MARRGRMRYKYAATCHRRVAHAALGGCGCGQLTHQLGTGFMTSSYNPITGTSADTLFGSTDADSIDALGGDDIVYRGGSKSDIVALGSGNDSINFSTDADGVEIYGQAGNDSLGFTASLNTSTVSGGTANDSLWISKGTAYKAYGDLGNDTINNADFKGASVWVIPDATQRWCRQYFCFGFPPLLTQLAMVVTTPCTSKSITADPAPAARAS